MKICILLITIFLIYQCKPDFVTDSGIPCLEYKVPNEWKCEARISYLFCFPSSYESDTYLWIKSEPYSQLSKGIFKEGIFKDIDENDFINFPLPDIINLPENNKLTNKIEICDGGDVIGVFYYGNVNFDNVHDYVGYLYLKPDESNSKFYLSAYSDMTFEGIGDILDVIRRIKRIE